MCPSREHPPPPNTDANVYTFEMVDTVSYICMCFPGSVWHKNISTRQHFLPATSRKTRVTNRETSLPVRLHHTRKCVGNPLDIRAYCNGSHPLMVASCKVLEVPHTWSIDALNRRKKTISFPTWPCGIKIRQQRVHSSCSCHRPFYKQENMYKHIEL